MHFDSLTDMYKFFGKSAPTMLDYVARRLDVHKTVVPALTYLNHAVIKRDVTINGFTLREIDAFVEGQQAIIQEMKEDLVDNPTEESLKKWIMMLHEKELSDKPVVEEPAPTGVVVHTIEDEPEPFNEKGELNEQE